MKRRNLAAMLEEKQVLDRSRRVPEQVYEILKNSIITGEIAPSAKINERGLTLKLGVSRTPIREAIRRLVDEGLVEVIPSVGSRVSPMDPARILDLAEARLELECLVIRRAADKFTTECDSDLANLIALQHGTLETEDYITNIRVDSRFHRRIWSLSGMSAIAEILERSLSEILRARHLSIKVPGRLVEPISEHQIILEALRSGNAADCESAMRVHLSKSHKSIVEATISSQPTTAGE